MKWRPSEHAIPKDRTKPGARVLLKDQFGNVAIGAWRPYGGPFIIESDTCALGARFDLCMRLPK